MAFNRLSGLLWQSLAIAVFRLQVSADRRIKLLRIAHHLPPVRGFDPSVLIGEANAVEIADKRPLLRPGLAGRRYFVVDNQSSYPLPQSGQLTLKCNANRCDIGSRTFSKQEANLRILGKHHTLGRRHAPQSVSAHRVAGRLGYAHGDRLRAVGVLAATRRLDRSGA
jgi:hypothetical protein